MATGEVPQGRFVVPDRGVPVDFLYEPVANAKTTVIFFHGAVLGTISLPWHPGERIVENVRANRLAISDPSLALDDSHRLTLGWHAGSSQQPALQRFIELVVRRISEVTGIQNLVFIGGSGGGFAALETSRRFGGSVVVAMNPQTSIGRYNPEAIDRYVDLSWGVDSLQDISPFATHDLVQAYPSHPTNTVAYVQNTRDKNHVEFHQIPFFEKVGESRDVLMLMDSWGDPEGSGHVIPPRNTVRDIVRYLVASNGEWRKALVGLGFNHLTSALTVRRTIRKIEARDAQTVDA